MAAVIVAKSAVYEVKPSASVTLSITIGDGQAGGSVVRFKGAKIGPGPAIQSLRIPQAGDADQDLKDKTVSCTTTVERINSVSSHSSVTYSLRGGGQDSDFTFDATLPEMGQLAEFRTTIIFE